MTRTIGIRDLKARTSAVLREVQDEGAEFIVTVRGRPAARLEPVEVERTFVLLDGMGNSRGTREDLPQIDWVEFQAMKKLWGPQLFDAG